MHATCCRACWHYHNTPAFRDLWGGPPLPWTNQCIHLGATTGERRLCETCTGHVEVKLMKCAVHGQCSTRTEFSGVACCEGCPDRKVRTILHIEPTTDGRGLGDHLMTLTIAAGLKRANHEAVVVVGASESWQSGWLEIFEGHDHAIIGKVPAEKVYRPCATWTQQQKELTARSRAEYYSEACDGVAPVIPKLKPLPADVLEWARPYAGCIVLATGSSSSWRTWPAAHWHTLETLLLAQGYSCVILDDRNGRRDFKSPLLLGESPQRVAAVVRAANALVGNDSAMCHLAGLLGTPTLALTGPMPGSKIFAVYPGVKAIEGPLECTNCHGDSAVKRRAGCDGGNICLSLAAITPAQVLEAVNGAACLLGHRNTLLGPAKVAALRRAVRETAGLPGAMAELGVYRGGSALAMATAAPGKVLHLFDTFAGLPADDPIGAHRRGEFWGSLEVVRPLLSGQRVEYHPGVFPETAAGLREERYSCVHVDGDLYQTTRDAIDYFWARMVPGALLVFDDWLWEKTPGVERAIREKFAEAEIESPVRYQAWVRKGVD